MGRPKTGDVEKLRKQIIMLTIEEFFELYSDMEKIIEIREEIAAKAEVQP